MEESQVRCAHANARAYAYTVHTHTHTPRSPLGMLQTPIGLWARAARTYKKYKCSQEGPLPQGPAEKEGELWQTL